MAKSDHRVNVYWEAVPYSDNYYRLNPAEQTQVNALLVAKVDTLVPPQQQQGWRNILMPNTDYNDILAQINAILTQEVVPPVGTELVLPSENAVYWLPTQMGHRIIFFAKLQDLSGANERTWEFHVTYNGGIYDARMGLAYECIPA